MDSTMSDHLDSGIRPEKQEVSLDRDEQALAFLRRVLPPEGAGLYCLFKKKPAGHPQTQHVSTIEELWRQTQEFERGGKGNVYFALAIFKDNSSREAANALEVCCFFADIDVDKDKAKEGVCHATPDAVNRVLKKFLAATGWPTPIIVGSGHGIHLYWPLTEPLPVHIWKPHAEKLKRLFRVHGLLADPSVTADAARVLRVPGTVNRKDSRAPIDVTMQPGALNTGPYELETFLPALKAVGDTGIVIWPDFGPKPDYLRTVTGRFSFAEAKAGIEPEPFPSSDAMLVAQACAQIKFMWDERGVMPEPDWRGCLSVLKFCEGGEELAHEWSRGDERYTREETQRKLDAIEGPHKCETFAGMSNHRCEGCPHEGKITSPVELGRPAVVAIAAARAVVERDIAKVNEDYFLVPAGSKVVIGSFEKDAFGQEVLQLRSAESFKLWFGNQYAQVVGANGSFRKKPLGAYWLGHRDRRQYSVLDIVPGAPQDLPNGGINLWRGYGVEAKAGDWLFMKHHILEVLGDGDPKAAEYITQYAAWYMQHPGERAQVALVLKGDKGCGKGVFLRALTQCFGPHAMHLSNQDHLLGKFNAHLRSALFLFADEAFWAGDKRGEGVLKAMITEPSLIIEQKGIDAVSWRNRLSITMATNAEWAVPAGGGERRFAVFQCTDTYVMGRCPDADRMEYFRALHDDQEHGGIEAMLHDLLHLDLKGWHPRQVYETAALQGQKEESLSPIDGWWVELLQEGKLPGGGRIGERKDFATAEALVEDAIQKAPRLRGYLNKN
jgi:hypothetical protein